MVPSSAHKFENTPRPGRAIGIHLGVLNAIHRRYGTRPAVVPLGGKIPPTSPPENGKVCRMGFAATVFCWETPSSEGTLSTPHTHTYSRADVLKHSVRHMTAHMTANG